MAVFTTVSRRELDTALADYGLPPALSVIGQSAGIDNTTLRVTTGAATVAVSLIESAVLARGLGFSLRWMRFLAAVGIRCPQPGRIAHLPRIGGKPVVVVPWVEGRSPEAVDAVACRLAGALLGRLHRRSRGFAAVRRNPRGLAWCRRAVPWLLPAEPVAERALTDAVVLIDPALPRGTIHGDLFPDNLLLDAQGPVVLDFFYASTDALLYDLAVAINAWCGLTDTGGLCAARTSALIDGYASERRLTPAECAAMPAALRLTALRFWLSRLAMRRRVQGAMLTGVRRPEFFGDRLHWLDGHRAVFRNREFHGYIAAPSLVIMRASAR